MTGMIIKYGRDYNVIKDPHGNKQYVPVIYWRAKRRICRQVFKRASDAVKYSQRFREKIGG